MSYRGLLCVFGSISVLSAGITIPRISTAQLADTMAATSIRGGLQGLQNTKAGLKAAKGTRSLQKSVNAQRAQDEALLQGSQMPVAGESAALSTNSNKFVAASAIKGHRYTASGMVVFDGTQDNQRMIFIVRPGENSKYEVMGFHVTDTSMPQIEQKTPVFISGIYAGQVKDPKTGAPVHGFEEASVLSIAGTPVQSALKSPATLNGESKPEKPTFNDILHGWSFRGTVEVEGKTTGVFAKDKELIYAQAGMKLDDTVKVLALSNGKAKLSVGIQKLEVGPW